MEGSEDRKMKIFGWVNSMEETLDKSLFWGLQMPYLGKRLYPRIIIKEIKS